MQVLLSILLGMFKSIFNMKSKYFTTIVAVSILSLGLIGLTTSCSNTQANQSNTDTNVAAQDTDVASPVYIESTSGLAIRGTDPVAYFTVGKPVAGSSEYQYEWNGATWQFSSQENLDLFAANPEEYAPQYGGYCAKAVSEGNLASIDPQSWKIVDGKLYLNYSPEVQQQWSEDIPGNITLADEQWPEVLNGTEVHENEL